jgi:L-erythro-3,5-diaminohexanoate dehydrogenase
MKAASPAPGTRGLGADRVIAPAGALPQPAERLDASGPVRPHELELSVDRLCLDSTSFEQISAAADRDPERIGERILEIVAGRGKMHNPETDSGGVAVGAVTAVGSRFEGPAPAIGDRIVTLASLTLTPLRLQTVEHVEPGSPQIAVQGCAYVAERSPWGPVPDDLPLEPALAAYDVYGAASHTRALAPAGGCVCVLGCGHAGLLALAAARDGAEGATTVAVDADPAAVARAEELGLCDFAVVADLRDPLAAAEAAGAAGAPAADLCVFVVSAAGCEPAAILLTDDAGTVLFFSMATSFQTAALTADGMGSRARMLVGSGYAADEGAYALELLRRNPALCAALEGAA